MKSIKEPADRHFINSSDNLIFERFRKKSVACQLFLFLLLFRKGRAFAGSHCIVALVAEVPELVLEGLLAYQAFSGFYLVLDLYQCHHLFACCLDSSGLPQPDISYAVLADILKFVIQSNYAAANHFTV